MTLTPCRDSWGIAEKLTIDGDKMENGICFWQVDVRALWNGKCFREVYSARDISEDKVLKVIPEYVHWLRKRGSFFIRKGKLYHKTSLKGATEIEYDLYKVENYPSCFREEAIGIAGQVIIEPSLQTCWIPEDLRIYDNCVFKSAVRAVFLNNATKHVRKLSLCERNLLYAERR